MPPHLTDQLASGDAERTLPPRGRRTRPIPAGTLMNLQRVCRIAARAKASSDPQDRMELRAAVQELLKELPAWPIGLRVIPLIRDEPNGRLSVCLTLDKPRNEGPTERLLDFEAVLVLLAHCVAGGRIDLEPHGPGSFYYFRLTLPKMDLPAQFRAYVLRLIVDTPTGSLTREHHNYWDLRRISLGRLRANTGEKQVWLGVEEAKGATLEALGRRIALDPLSLPEGLNIASAARLLDDAYELLAAVPLGQDAAA